MIKRTLDKIHKKLLGGLPFICPICNKILSARNIGENRYILECPGDSDYLAPVGNIRINNDQHHFDIVYNTIDNKIISYTADVIVNEQAYRFASTQSLTSSFPNQKRTVIYKINSNPSVNNPRFGEPVVLDKVYMPFEVGLQTNVEKMLKLSAFI